MRSLISSHKLLRCTVSNITKKPETILHPIHNPHRPLSYSVDQTNLDHVVPPTRKEGTHHKSILEHPEGVLVRDFVRESLYADTGYFNSSRVINSPGVINFSNLLGKAAYNDRLTQLYYAGVQGWTTPVEIFQPFYGQALIRYFLSHITPSINRDSYIPISVEEKKEIEKRKNKSKNDYGIDVNDEDDDEELFEDVLSPIRRFGVIPKKKDQVFGKLNIYEVGAGNGTCALNILDYLRMYYPSIYKGTLYNTIEMSEVLSWQQRELLDAHHPGHSIVNTANAAEWDSKNTNHSFIFGLEVLDNMIHDKVVSVNNVWYQVMVKHKDAPLSPEAVTNVSFQGLINTGTSAEYEEFCVPISDPIISQVLTLYTEYLDENDGNPIEREELNMMNSNLIRENEKKGLFERLVNYTCNHILTKKKNAVKKDILYLPTELYRFLLRLDVCFPKHTLLLADFDALPSTEKVQGVHGPVVAHKKSEADQRGLTKDEDTYLTTLGKCDIFYPTDFGFLKYMYVKTILKDGKYRNTLNNSTIDENANSKITPNSNIATVCTQYDFLYKYSHFESTECRNGYNPMLEDYDNMMIFVGGRQ